MLKVYGLPSEAFKTFTSLAGAIRGIKWFGSPDNEHICEKTSIRHSRAHIDVACKPAICPHFVRVM